MSDFGVVWAMLDVANFQERRIGEVRIEVVSLFRVGKMRRVCC
jgi:hypothetical protein